MFQEVIQAKAAFPISGILIFSTGLAAWITWKMPDPLAPLELTIEAPGRITIDGKEVRGFDEQQFESRLRAIAAEKPDAFTVSLINSFANDEQYVSFN